MNYLKKNQKVKVVRPSIACSGKTGEIVEHIKDDDAGFSLYSVYFPQDSSTWHLWEGDFEVLE